MLIWKFFFLVLFLRVVFFALFVCFFFVVKSRSQIFCNTSFSKKRKGNASYGRNNFTPLFFPLFLSKGRRSSVAIIPVAFSVIKATTRNALIRIAKILDSIISNMKNFPMYMEYRRLLSKRAPSWNRNIYFILVTMSSKSGKIKSCSLKEDCAFLKDWFELAIGTYES